MQQSVQELFEDLSYEMPPVPFGGQELFRNVIKVQFGKVFAGLTLPAAVVSIEAVEPTSAEGPQYYQSVPHLLGTRHPRPSTSILDSAPFPVLGLAHLPCLQMASCR